MTTTTDLGSSNAMTSIESFFGPGDRVDLPGLAAFLDGLDHAGRVRETRKLKKAHQSRLFEAAKSVKPITLADFVPDGTPVLTEVIHDGRNTLPTFNFFQKRFCRPAASEGGKTDELWGYNEGSTRWLVGPGYFVTKVSAPGEVVIDYYEIPPGKPTSWPEIRQNSAGLSRLVYYHMRDYMRGVSKHVTIGRAFREEKAMDAWFVLTREG